MGALGPELTFFGLCVCWIYTGQAHYTAAQGDCCSHANARIKARRSNLRGACTRPPPCAAVRQYAVRSLGRVAPRQVYPACCCGADSGFWRHRVREADHRQHQREATGVARDGGVWGCDARLRRFAMQCAAPLAEQAFDAPSRRAGACCAMEGSEPGPSNLAISQPTP